MRSHLGRQKLQLVTSHAVSRVPCHPDYCACNSHQQCTCVNLAWHTVELWARRWMGFQKIRFTWTVGMTCAGFPAAGYKQSQYRLKTSTSQLSESVLASACSVVVGAGTWLACILASPHAWENVSSSRPELLRTRARKTCTTVCPIHAASAFRIEIFSSSTCAQGRASSDAKQCI